MGLHTPQKSARENFKDYSKEEMAALQKKYTPGQLKAIEAGEAAIDPEDLNNRGVIRTDIGALPYLDDFSQLRPVLDRAPAYEGPIDPNTRLMTGDEMIEAWDRAYEEAYSEDPPPPPPEMPEDMPIPQIYQKSPSRLAMMKADDRAEMFMGTNGPIPIEHTSTFLAPGLPRTFLNDEETKVQTKKEDTVADADSRDPDGLYNRLMKQTGLTLDEIFDYKVKILVKHRVVNQTRLGKIASVYCLAVAGNGNGRLGIGEAKGESSEDTSSNARIAAIRNMQPIPRYEERTIYGEVEGKVSAVEVKLMSRPPGKFEPLHQYQALANIS
jgi:small subunit ribosomal protein S5